MKSSEELPIAGAADGKRTLPAGFASQLHAGYTQLRRIPLQGRWVAFLLVAVFSVLYFAETVIRASEKPFWFDELCTFYIVRLPTFAASWSAVLHGADYNPPLFYLIQRADRRLFGEGLISMRLPAMIGFWTLCVCLFRFASKCAGPVAGWIAMVLPVLTGAYYYAYEARPHGIVLGFCGLALVCWQASEEEGTHRTAWILAFAASSGGAFFTHCYALVVVIPFWISEGVHVLRWRHLRPLRWVVLTVPALAATLSFAPLLRSYRANVTNTIFSASFSASAAQVAGTYAYLVFPCLPILLLTLAILSISFLGSRPESATWRGIDAPLVAIPLTIGLLTVPWFGLALALVTHGPFVPRYFMAAAAGLALAVAFSLSNSRQDWRSGIVALVVAALLFSDARKVLWHRHKGYGEAVTEQSSGFLLGELRNPIVFYPLLTSAPKDVPIVVAEPLDFLYLVHYAPERASQLFYIADTKDDLFYRLYSALRKSCHLTYNEVQTVAEFLPRHPAFNMYGNTGLTPWLYSFPRRGASISSVQFGERGRFLAVLTQQVAN